MAALPVDQIAGVHGAIYGYVHDGAGRAIGREALMLHPAAGHTERQAQIMDALAAADVVSVFAHGETGRKQRVLHARLEAPSPGERLLHRETEGDGPVMVFLLLDAARVVVGNLDARERVVSDIGRGKCLEEVGILLPCAYVARQLEARSVRLRHA